MTNSGTLNEEMITELNFELVKEEKIVQDRENDRSEGNVITIWKINILARTESMEGNVVVHAVRDSKKSVNN